jgi:hypothetical protein
MPRLDFMVVGVKHHGYNWTKKKCCYDILGHEIITSSCNSWKQGNASSMWENCDLAARGSQGDSYQPTGTKVEV